MDAILPDNTAGVTKKKKKRKEKGYNLADYQNHYLIFFLFSFLNYESMITQLQEIWKI